MSVMNHVSRPLIGLLAGTVLFFALWVVALKPSSSGMGSAGVGQYQSAINKARATVASHNGAAATAAGGAVTTTPAATPGAATVATKAVPRTQSAKSHPGTAPAVSPRLATPAQRLDVIDRALVAHKVLALLFYNPAGADDQAVKRELRTVPASRGRVVRLAVPLNEINNYPVVTKQVLIQSSPTLVIIDSDQHAFTLVGYADRFEIVHRVDGALSVG